MARIFISHSSKNNPEAVALRDWLVGEGWDDLFLDLDPERGIVAGERWERALSEAANRCEAVLLLVSRAWLESHWCLRELNLALKLNKRVFGVLIEEIQISELPPELSGVWQLVNLAAGTDHDLYRTVMPSGQEAHITFSKTGLQKLKGGLVKAGLDPRFFAWPPDDDPERPPYRGLHALEAEDAGIFFGREAPTIEALDRLRGLSDAAPPRVFVILGASGAGKSSFLRAGLMPRLERDDRNFLPLQIIRPERAALTGENGLQRSLEVALKVAGLRRTRSEVKTIVDSGAKSITALLSELVEKCCPPALKNEDRRTVPRIVLLVDQSEELFLAEGTDEAQALLRLLRELAIDPDSNLIVLFSIRSDSFEYLQTAPVMEDIRAQTFSLPPLPKGAYQTVIEGPAARLRDTPRALRIEPSLTAALLADIEAGGAKDALPLLAFTLERLYLEHGGDGDLRLAEYRAIGGIRGSIEAAVEQALKAADGDPAVPKDRTARLVLLRRALIPWLAGIDPESGAPRRRVARLSEIPEEARPLIEHLVTARLLATDISPETSERTIEPAHEALLRQWGLLQGWLEEDFAALTTLEGVKRAARDWEANARNTDWLAHTAGRLEDAEVLSRRADLARFFDAIDRTYIDACRTATNAKRDKELEETRRRVRLQRRLVLITSVAALIFFAVGSWAWFERTNAQDEAARAEQQAQVAYRAEQNAKSTLRESRASTSRFLAVLARKRIDEGRLDDAIALAREAVPIEVADWPRVRTAENALTFAMQQYSHALVKPVIGLVGHEGTVRGGAFSPKGNRLLTWSYDGTARLWDVKTGVELRVFQHDGGVRGARFSSDGSKVLTWSFDGTLRLWNPNSENDEVICRHEDVVVEAVFSRDEKQVLSWSYDGTARLWDANTGEQVALLKHEDAIHKAQYFDDDKRILTLSFDGTARIWSSSDGALLATLQHESGVGGAIIYAHDSRIFTWSYDKTGRVWDANTGKELQRMDHEWDVGGAELFTDEKRILTWADNVIHLWDLDSGKELAHFTHDARVIGATLSKNEQRILSWSTDRAVQIWSTADAKRLARFTHTDQVIGARFSPDDSQILSWSYDETALLWTIRSGEQSKEPILLRHNGVVRNAVFDKSGAWVWTRSDDGTVRLWRADTGSLTATLRHQGEVFGILWSGNGLAVTFSADGTAIIWDLSPKDRFVALSHQDKVIGAVFSNDGTRLLSWSADHTARQWDSTSGDLDFVLEHDEDILGAKFATNDGTIVTWSVDKTIHIWDAKHGKEINRLEGTTTPVGVAYAADMGRLLGRFEDGSVRLWNTASGDLLAEYMAEKGLTGASFSSDGRLALVWSSTGVIRVLDSSKGGVLATFAHDKLAGVIFSPDCTKVLSWSDNGTARSWDIANKTMLAEMAHEASIVDAGFSPKGEYVIARASDSTVAKVWDAATGKEIHDLVHGDVVDAGLFGDDGRIWTSSAENVHAWQVQTGKESLRIHAGGSLVAIVENGQKILTRYVGLRYSNKLWDAQNGDLISEHEGPTAEVIARDGRRVADWSKTSNTVRVWTLPNFDESLIAESTQLVKYLRPLSKIERCHAYLDMAGCESITATTSQRELALDGDASHLFGSIFNSSRTSIYDYRAESKVRRELIVNDRGEAVLFHNNPFGGLIKRVEFNKVTGEFALRMQSGRALSLGTAVSKDLTKYFEDSTRILMVLTDRETGQPLEGQYYPLLVY